MAKKLSVYFFLPLLWFSAAAYGNNKPDTVAIAVHIKKGRQASFYFNTQYDDAAPPCFLSGKDRLKRIVLTEPALLIDSYHQIPFLVYPGENLSLEVDESGLPLLSVPGNETRNNELRFFVDYFRLYKKFNQSALFTPPKGFTLYDSKYNFEDGIKEAQSDSIKRFAYLRKYKKASPVSAQFDSYTRDFFKYLYFIDVIRPISFVGINYDALPGRYISTVDQLSKELPCDTCLANEAYRRANIDLIKFMTRKFRHRSDKFSRAYDTLSAAFKGETRRFVLYNLLKNDMAALPINFEAKLKLFVSEKPDEYSTILSRQQGLVDQFKSAALSDKEIAATDGTKFSWDEFLQKHKGYTIYLDFWASWCAPCRKFLPDSHQLEESLKNKNILFLYLSIDDAPANWIKAMHDEGMDKTRSYLLLNQKSALLKKRFKIKSIPRYMIINSNGAIIDDNAPFPNNPELKKTLSALKS